MANSTKPRNLPTIQDVAEHAGVSTASVSRVLNNSDSITEDIYQRVNAAIDALGYRPQRNRAKATNTNSWLFILVEKIGEPFFLEVIDGIQEEAKNQDLTPVIICTSDRHSRIMETLEQLKAQTCNGMIIAGVYLPPEEWIKYQKEVGNPIIALNTSIHHPCMASVMVDFETSGVQVVQHLLSLNHSRIAYMGDYENGFGLAQLEGVKRALRAAGMEYPEEYRFSIPNTAEGASQGISKMMTLPEALRPTAIFAFDDVLAIHILNAIRYYGLRIPDDLSIVGFDNIAMSAHSNPPLTTVDIPKRRIGHLMVQLINEVKKAPAESMGHTIIQGNVLVRGSTGRAKV